MNEMESLAYEYHSLLQKQQFDPSILDYKVFKNQIPFLDQLSKIDSSAVSVFDLYKREHIYASYNFSTLFDIDQEEAIDTEAINSRIHPEDMPRLLRIGIKMMRYYYQLPRKEAPHYKLINEYRLRNGENKYIRVIEQHKALELDALGNLWLSLSMVDISPNQKPIDTVLSQVVNTKTGKTFSLEIEDPQKETPKLTRREYEILNLAKTGLLSKEISDQLNISVHTVNTHRQRILQKTNANNTVEAIQMASKYGLI